MYINKLISSNPPISHGNLSMNRLLNRVQWDKSNDLTPVGIGLELMEILKVEWVICLNIGFRAI